jgi:hypothetical protein
MNQILAGSTMIALGAVMLVIYNRSIKAQENTAFQTPYLRNAGVGFILFGLYFLAKYYAA